MRVALVVNNPHRDLAGLVLVALRLCENGATCYFVPQAFRERELSALAPDVVLMDDMRPARHQLHERLLDAGIKMLVLDNEGGVFSSLDWYGDALNPDAALRHRVAAFCSWGTRLAEHAADQDWYKSEQVRVTGHPRFDFYAEPWKNVVLPGAPDAAQFKKPIVLISGRYSIANPHNDTPEDKAKRLIRLRKYTAEQSFAILESQRRGMNQMVELVNALASRFPAVTFVYRPHPFERLETYHDLLKLNEYSNLHLSKQGTIHGWLAIADAVVHRGCTTAIEAGMLDVPALSPRWVDTPEEIESSESVSIPCSNQQELEEKILLLEQGVLRRPEEIKAKHNQVIHDWFYKIDGQAHQRVANAILESATNTPVDLKKCEQLFDASAKKPPASLRSRVKKSIRGLFSSSEAKWEESEVSFNADSVCSVIKAISQGASHLNIETNVGVSAATENKHYRLPLHNGKSVVISPSN